MWPNRNRLQARPNHVVRLAFLFSLAIAAQAQPFRVLSLNLHSEPDASHLIRELESEGLADADFLLLQEVIGEDMQSSAVARQLARNGSWHVFYRGAFPLPSGKVYGLAIVSRYPLRDLEVIPLPRINLNLRSRVRIALAATADTPRGPVRIVNTHLDTRIELARRLEQLEPALARSARQSNPVILGGDFNTNPCRWIWNMLPVPYGQDQAAGLESHMRSRGFVNPVPARLATHDLFGMRLDWVFLRGFSHAGYRVQPMRYTDHHAVSVDVSPL